MFHRLSSGASRLDAMHSVASGASRAHASASGTAGTNARTLAGKCARKHASARCRTAPPSSSYHLAPDTSSTAATFTHYSLRGKNPGIIPADSVKDFAVVHLPVFTSVLYHVTVKRIWRVFVEIPRSRFRGILLRSQLPFEREAASTHTQDANVTMASRHDRELVLRMQGPPVVGINATLGEADSSAVCSVVESTRWHRKWA
jgi:hypothetical protein